MRSDNIPIDRSRSRFPPPILGLSSRQHSPQIGHNVLEGGHGQFISSTPAWVLDQNGPWAVAVAPGTVESSSPIRNSRVSSPSYQGPFPSSFPALEPHSPYQMSHCKGTNFTQNGGSPLWSLDGFPSSYHDTGNDQFSADQVGLDDGVGYQLTPDYSLPARNVHEMQELTSNLSSLPPGRSSECTQQSSLWQPSWDSHQQMGSVYAQQHDSDGIHSSPGGSSEYMPQMGNLGEDTGEMEIQAEQNEVPSLQGQTLPPSDTRKQSRRARVARQGRQQPSNDVRTHEWYHRKAATDGKWYCPVENCPHHRQGIPLLCNYHKHIDQHKTPYRCRDKACENRRFSSTGCKLRHEREAHGRHNAVNFYCPVPGCERAAPGRPFPRQWNMKDHIKRVHPGYEGPHDALEPSLDSHSSPVPLERTTSKALNDVPYIQKGRYKRSSQTLGPQRSPWMAEQDEKMDYTPEQDPPSSSVYSPQGSTSEDYTGLKLSENLMEVENVTPAQHVVKSCIHHAMFLQELERALTNLENTDGTISVRHCMQISYQVSYDLFDCRDDAESRDDDRG